MMDYEISRNRTSCLKPPSGCRTLLRLHRAMESIVRLIKDIHDSEETDKMPSVAKKAYGETLAKYHPWVIRKAVHLAVHALPNRNGLLQNLSGHLRLNRHDEEQAMKDMVNAGHSVYNRVQALYTDYNLLDLP